MDCNVYKLTYNYNNIYTHIKKGPQNSISIKRLHTYYQYIVAAIKFRTA